MRAVDTNVLVRLIIRDDPKQVAAGQEFVKTGVWVSTVALAETTWVLRAIYGHGSADIAGTVDMLLNHKAVTLQDSEVVAAALENFRARPALGFSDCLLLELALKAGHLPLGTLDRDLRKLDGAQKL